MNEQARARIRAFLAAQRPKLNNEQWMRSYQSWARGGHAWDRYGLGGTDINTALAWYHWIHKPGSREWRPSIVMDAVSVAAATEAAT